MQQGGQPTGIQAGAGHQHIHHLTGQGAGIQQIDGTALLQAGFHGLEGHQHIDFAVGQRGLVVCRLDVDGLHIGQTEARVLQPVGQHQLTQGCAFQPDTQPLRARLNSGLAGPVRGGCGGWRLRGRPFQAGSDISAGQHGIGTGGVAQHGHDVQGLALIGQAQGFIECEGRQFNQPVAKGAFGLGVGGQLHHAHGRWQCARFLRQYQRLVTHPRIDSNAPGRRWRCGATPRQPG